MGAGASVGARWRAVSGSWRAGAALVALCLAVYLPGLRSIPAVDRDEARFAQASRQMFEAAALAADAPERARAGFYDGGWAVPKVQDRERLNKPPLIYWMQVASAWVFTGGEPGRDAIWMYRVPSVVGAIATVLITWRLGCRMFDPRTGWLAGAMLAVAPMVVWDAHQARSDSVMMAWTAGAMAGLWGVWRVWQAGGARGVAPSGLADSATSPGGSGGGWWWVVAMWLCVAGGVMTKGFVTPMVVGLAVAWLSWSTRSWRWVWRLRPEVGAVVVALAVVPWVYWVAQHKGGVGAYARIVWDEFFVRGVAGSKEGHFWPPGMHTVALAVLFWPGSLMTLAGFVRAWRRGRGCTAGGAGRWAWVRERWRGREAEMFLVAWIVPAWVVFELSPAKLLHYTMPMLPAVALVSARMVLATGVSGARVGGVWIWGLIGLAPVLAAGGAVVAARAGGASLLGGGGGIAWATVGAAGLAGVVLLALAAVDVGAGRVVAGQARSCVGMALCAASALGTWVGGVVPGAQSAAIGEAIAAVDPGMTRPVASVPRADSLVFATRGRVEFVSEEAAGGWLAAHPEGLLVLRDGGGGRGGAAVPTGVRVLRTFEDRVWVLVEAAR